MKKKRIRKYNPLNFAAIFGLIVISFFSGLQLKAQSSSLTVISNQNGSPSSLKFSELKSIFMGEQQRWKSGTKITIALMKTNTPAGKIASQKIYGMSSDELNKFWLALVFQGKAQAPNFFSSASELENFVAQNPGAIGILDKPIPDFEIKAIMIDGQKTF